MLLSGYSPTSGVDGFCGPLLEDQGLAAGVFVVATPGMVTQGQIESRLALIEEIDPPAELSDELDIWKEYLETIVDTIEAEDPTSALAAYRADPAIEPAGDALFEQYTSVCMK